MKIDVFCTSQMAFWSKKFFDMTWASCRSCSKNGFPKFSNVFILYLHDDHILRFTFSLHWCRTVHFRSVASYCKIPIALPSTWTSLLFCSWAWSIASFQKAVLDLLIIKYPLTKLSNISLFSTSNDNNSEIQTASHLT